MRRLALLAALAAALPAAAQQEDLPPPPPPPSFDQAPAPPSQWPAEPAQQPPPQWPPGTEQQPSPAPPPYGVRPRPPAPAAVPAQPGEPQKKGVRAPRKPGTIGEAPVAPAGSQAAPLHPDENFSHWRFALATGIGSKFGGMQLDVNSPNPTVLLYFGGQADGLWTEGFGQSARIRFRMFTGGETEVYIPSDGDAEAAFMIGRREFRFVIGRLEVGRYPALGVNFVAQFATLPCFEGSLSLAGDTMRLYYHLSPVEAAFVRYYGRAHIQHIPGWLSEDDQPVAASSGRLRYTVLLPPAVLLSLQGDLVKMWNKADLLVSGEGSLGYQALDQTATFNVAIRWNGYTRRGNAPQTEVTDSEIVLLGIATLAF